MGDEDSEDFDAAGGDDDSFDDDFDANDEEDELPGDDDDFDLEAYLKWRAENPDADDNQGPGAAGGANDPGAELPEDDEEPEDDYDDEDDD